MTDALFRFSGRLKTRRELRQHPRRGCAANRLLAVAVLVLLATTAEAACVKDGDHITLSGELFRQTFPGPPNYESIRDGTAAETYFLLRLYRSSCFDERPDEAFVDSFKQKADDVRVVQLLLNERLYRQYRPLLGRAVTLSGEVLRAQTGHHKTFYLLDIAGKDLP